jgi:hypothetical protein
MSKMETSHLSAMSTRLTENEQMSIQKVEELRSLQLRFADIERKHASQIESLYV